MDMENRKKANPKTRNVKRQVEDKERLEKTGNGL